MPTLYGEPYSRSELLRRAGHLAQLGGVQLLEAADGPARGVRFLEFRLGSGFTFKVALERGMDVATCEYNGMPLGWIPPTLLPGPWYFEKQEDFGWLRTALGGFCTTCGLLHIGNPESDSVAQYNFAARAEERYGVHDRAAMLPAQLMAYGEEWQGDECLLKAEGRMIQAQVYGENLVLQRSYMARLGEKRYCMHDEVTNAGHYPTPLMLLYHINIGFPFVDDGARLLAHVTRPPQVLAGGPEAAQVYDHFSAPQAGAELQAFELSVEPDREGWAGAAVIDPRLGRGGLGAYIRYRPQQFPKFLTTRLMGEGHYFTCLEPATNGFGRAALRQSGEMIILQPGESRVYDLEAGVLEGEEEIKTFISPQPQGGAPRRSQRTRRK